MQTQVNLTGPFVCAYENLNIPAADAAKIVYNLYHSRLKTTRKRCLILYKYFIEKPDSNVSMKSISESTIYLGQILLH